MSKSQIDINELITFLELEGRGKPAEWLIDLLKQKAKEENPDFKHRKTPRARADYIIHYRKIFDSRKKDHDAAQTSNISSEGLAFAAEEQFPAHTPLDITFVFPGSSETYRIQAQVRWSRQRSSRGARLFDTGVLFADIDSVLKERLHNRVESITRSLLG